MDIFNFSFDEEGFIINTGHDFKGRINHKIIFEKPDITITNEYGLSTKLGTVYVCVTKFFARSNAVLSGFRAISIFSKLLCGSPLI